MRNLRHFIVYLICIGLFFSVFTYRLSAVESTTNNEMTGEVAPTKQETPTETENKPKPEAVIVGEVEDKREEYSKTFMLEDFTYLVATYDEPVHIQANGKWEDIDNTLQITNGNEIADNQVLQNTKGRYDIKLAKNSQSNQLVTYSVNGYQLKWRFVDSAKTWAETVSNTSTKILSANDEKLKLSKLQSQVIYREMYPNVDIRYTFSPARLKEDIILKSALARNFFISEYDLGGLVARQKDPQTIELYDPLKGDAVQIVMSAPYMEDAAGNVDQRVRLEIVSQTNGKLMMKTTAERSWLDDPKTVYPVTIDPTTFTYQDINKIDDTFVSSWNPTTNYSSMGSTWIGKEGASYGTCRILIKYPTLPILGSGDRVVSAKLNMVQSSTGFSGGVVLQMNLHEIKGTWNVSTATWNNTSTLNVDKSFVVDYFTTGYAYQSEYNTWDITKTVQKWYDNSLANNGVMIKSTDAFEAGSTLARNKYIGTGSNLSGLYPSLQIFYVNTDGLEDLWTYTTMDGGRAGGAYVNNHTGALVISRSDIAVGGGKLPAGINFYYDYDQKLTTARYSWRTNYNQTIAAVTISGTQYYKYTDADGTENYFYYDSTAVKWKDELGKGLTLTINSASTTARFVVKDKGFNTMEFDSSGYLRKIQDSSQTPNAINITYVSGRIDYLTDSSNRKYDFVYNGANQLVEIDYLGSGTTILRKVQYTYSSDNTYLVVTLPDDSQVKYYYDSSYRIIKAVNLEGGVEKRRLEFTYLTTGKAVVSGISEYSGGTSDAQGNHYDFTYLDHETVIKDKYGQDVYYQFDNFGRTMGIKDSDNAAQYYEYGASGGEKNKLTSVSKLQTTTTNLAINSSFETSGTWQLNDSSGLLTTPEYSTSEKWMGGQSLKIQHSGGSGRVIYAYEDIPITITGQTSYTVSAYVKSDTVEAAHLSLVGGSVSVSGIVVDQTNGWQRIAATITLSDTAITSLQVRLVVDTEATVYFDGVQLETGIGMNRYNLVENPSLEYINGTLPVGWSTVGTTTSDGTSTAQSVFDLRSYKLVGSTTVDKSLNQTIITSGVAGDVFAYGGWAKATAVPSTSTRKFRVSLTFNNTDATTTIKSVVFNNSSPSWQYVEGKAVADKAYSSVILSFEYGKQLQDAYFDGAQVYKEEFGQTFLYDAQGNLVSAKDMEGNSELTSYDSDNQLLKQVGADGTYVSYAYDKYHRPFVAKNSNGTASLIEYDVYGNPISTEVTQSAGLGNRLIAYYKFDDNVLDSSGNGHDGTNTGGTFVQGKVGNAIHFNGIDQFAELGDFEVPETFTITMWVKNERSSTVNESLVAKNDVNGGDRLIVGEYGTSIKVTAGAATSSQGTKTLGYHFLAVVFDKVNATTTHVKLYKDNVLIHNLDISGVIVDSTTGKPWIAGAQWDSETLKNDFFQGSIDELAFFNGELSAEEIQQLYDQVNGRTLIAKYDFSGAANGKILDTTINGHNATYHGGTTFSNDAMVLNGTTGYMQLDDFYIGQEMTVAMTVKPDVVRSYSLFAKHSSTGGNILIMGQYDGGIEIDIRDKFLYGSSLGSGTAKQLIYTVKKISSTKSEIQMYVDGVAQQTGSESKEIGSILGTTTGKPWIIGAEWDSSTLSDYFDGTIDNLTIYNYAMDATEVTNNLTAIGNGTYEPTKTVTAIPTVDSTVKSIRSTATYSTDGNYIKSVTDSRGNTVYYDYDETYGRLATFRAPGETAAQATAYTYETNSDRIDQITKQANGQTYVIDYTYGVDQLTAISHNGFNYEFTYDKFGNPNEVKIAGTVVSTTEYENNNGLPKQVTYGNGAVVNNTYDQYHRITAWSNGSNVVQAQYFYDNQSNLSRVVDNHGGSTVTYDYYYDFLNRITRLEGSNSHKMNFTYDSYGRVSAFSNIMSGTTYQHEYYYGDKNVTGELPGLIYNIKLNGQQQVEYSFDELARTSSRTIETTTPLTTSYTYLDGSGTNNTTTLLETLKNGTSDEFIYTYDANGNILTISEGSVLKATYTYDQLNQLSREDNNYTGKSIDYSYDIGGNLLSRSEYIYVGGIRGALIDTYNYQYSTTWKDQLVNYDGSVITYDNIGNPTKYRNSWDMTWDNGRDLSIIVFDEDNTVTYKYNADGIRTSKIVGTDTTTFLLNGSSIVRSTKGNLVMDFFYDEKGNLYGFKHGSAMYYYLRNGQNDIIGIIDNSGTQVVGYTYNSWGVVESVSGTLASTIGNDNPFRYRGYYLDNETGFYYLNSRYYDPQVGRFINADSVGLLASVMQNPNIDKNLYSYCDNNPVTRSDSSGKIWETIFDIVTIGFSIYDVCKNPSDPWAWAGLAGDVIDLIPIVTGVGEGIKAISKTNKIVDSIQAADNVADAVDAAGDARKAINNGIDTYGNLKKATKGSGLEVHHIVEKRLRDPLSISDTDSMLSVALSKADHRKFTKAWRDEIPYGTKYKDLKTDEIWGVAQKIYKDFPELLEASKKTIFR